MVLIAEMQAGGVFEAASKKKLTAAMVKHYAEINREPEQIKAIFCVFENGKTNEICQNAVSRVQELVEEAVAEWQKVSCQQSEENKEIQSDYWAGVL